MLLDKETARSFVVESMRRRDTECIPEELAPIAERLSEARGRPTPLELDRIKLRAMEQAEGARRLKMRERGFAMRSRAAITSMLAAGVLMSGTGAALGLSGPSGDGSAAEIQYVPPGVAPGLGGLGVLGEQGAGSPPSQGGNGPSQGGNLPSGGGNAPSQGVLGQQGAVNGPSKSGNAPSQGVLGEQGATAPSQAPTAQATRQEATKGGGRQLPFTGFAVLPLLLGGVALLITGLVMLRVSRRRPADL